MPTRTGAIPLVVESYEGRPVKIEGNAMFPGGNGGTDRFAQAAIHLGEYRKMNPGPIEEWIFFDHPSGYNRIHMAMTWKAENPDAQPR